MNRGILVTGTWQYEPVASSEGMAVILLDRRSVLGHYHAMSEERPVYLRLRDTIAAMILEGRVRDGDPLPSVRSLAADFGANPLTVAKAYQTFQEEGLVTVRRGVGMFVAAAGAADRLRTSERAASFSTIAGRGSSAICGGWASSPTIWSSARSLDFAARRGAKSVRTLSETREMIRSSALACPALLGIAFALYRL